MCPEELAIFVSGLAVAISKGKSNEELTVLSAVFTQLGDTLATIVAQRELCEARNKNNNNENNDDDDSIYNEVE